MSEQSQPAELTETQSDWLKRHGISPEEWSTLQNSIFPGAKPESIILARNYCKARKLDILKKPCHIVGMNVTNSKTGNTEWRDVIMPGIAEHRTTAMRTGCYAGMDDPIWGPMIEIQGLKVPEYCTLRVYRLVEINGHAERVPFPHTEYFEEVMATKRDGSINSMWTKRKRGQLYKCTEAGALRKAFPEELGGEATAEEMVGHEIDITPTTTISKPAQIPHYSDDDFNRSFDKWKGAISSGKKTPDDIINLAESKAKLSDDQKGKLRAIKVEADVTEVPA